MTPYQLNVALEVYSKRRQLEMEEQMSLVWLGEYWHRLKKLKPFYESIGKEKPKKEMTDLEMLDQVKKLNSMFGGNITNEEV